MTEEGKGERRWPRKMSRLEGGAWALECQWKARWRSHSWVIKSWARGKKMEDRALGGGTYGMCVLGLPRRWPPPCWAEERKTAPRGPTAAQCHVEAEVELEGTQDSEGGRLSGGR